MLSNGHHQPLSEFVWVSNISSVTLCGVILVFVDLIDWLVIKLFMRASRRRKKLFKYIKYHKTLFWHPWCSQMTLNRLKKKWPYSVNYNGLEERRAYCMYIRLMFLMLKHGKWSFGFWCYTSSGSKGFDGVNWNALSWRKTTLDKYTEG